MGIKPAQSAVGSRDVLGSEERFGRSLSRHPALRTHCLVGALQFGLLFTSSPRRPAHPVTSPHTHQSSPLWLRRPDDITAQDPIREQSHLQEHKLMIRFWPWTLWKSWTPRAAWIRIRFSPVLSRPLPSVNRLLWEGLQSAFYYITSRQSVR